MKLAKKNKHSKKNRLSLLALEPRLVFDGAMAVTGAEDLTGKVLQSSVDGQTVLDRSADMAIAPAPASLEQAAAGVNFLQLRPGQDRQVEQAAKEVESKVVALLRSDNWAQQLFPIFSAGQTSMNDAWLASAQAFRDNVLANGLQVAVKVVSADVILGIDGAYAAQGPDGRPVIYLNQDRVALLGAEFATRVLLEETGHWIDNQINAAADTQGDEGERFADTLLNVQLSELNQARIATENDHLNLTIDGRDVQVEMAALMFNGQSYFAGITAKSGLSAIGPDGQTAQLESNTLVIGNAIPGTRALFVSDPPDAAYYSGNNVRGNLYAIDANNNIVGKYYGEISRLIKIGSAPVSAQMYVYPTSDPNVTNINATTIIVDFYATAPTFKTGDIAKTSSDPVASALNSLLPVNQAPTAVADVSAALEAGGLNNTTAGSNAAGNVIANSDTDPNSTYVIDLVNNKVLTVQDSLSLSKVSNATAGTSAIPTAGSTSTTGGAVVAGLYGTLTIGADGSYNYAVNNSLAAVQALRGTANTLTDTYTYTVTDGKGGFSTTTLSITVKGANDNPIAVDDYNFAKESIESTVSNQYASTDLIGAKATGNVLPNDTDVDAYGETKTVTSLIATASGQTDGPTVLNFANGVPSSVKVGFYVYTAASPLTPLMVNGVQVTVSSIVGNNVQLSADAKLSVGGTLYFSSSNTSITSNGGSATYTAAAPSTGTGVSVSLTTDGYIAKGMTVSGTGVTAGTTVTAVTYDASGKVTGVTLSQNATIASNTTLTFSAAAGTTLTGHYGTLVLSADGSYVYTPFANNPALNAGDQVLDEFRYRMQDAAGATSDATLHITVLGSGPSDPNANADTVTATEAGGVANGTAGTNPTSNLLTNDTLGVGATAGLSVVGAKTADVATVTALSAGSVSYGGTNYDAKVTGKYGDLYLKADGTYLYVVNNDATAVQALKTGDNLAETFQYKITNGAGFDWSTLTVTVNGAYDAPVAVNDSNVAIVGQYVPVGNVLPNDTDVDAADTKTVTKIALGTTLGTSPSSVSLSSTYASSYTEIQGTYGKLRIGADGSYTYLVDTTNAAIIALGTGQQLANPDVFTYEVKDANGLVSTAKLTMNVEGRNDAPVNAYPSSTLTVQEGSNYALTGANIISASDVDSNLASVTISLTNGTLYLTETGSTGSAQTLETTLTGGAVIYGSETGSPNGTSSITLYGTQAQINAALATLVYTPNPGYVGADTLTIQSIDAESLRDTDTVTLNIAAPALTVTGTTVNEASPYTLFTVSGKEGQYVSLSLGNTSSTADKDATLGTDTGLTLEYFNGTSWVTYNAALNGGYVVIPSDGDAIPGENATLLVRVANNQDTANEGAETLQLTASNAAAVTATGVSTIVDDGTGSYFAANNNTSTSAVPAGVVLDDDRPLTVNSVTVNEGSPYATFTVTGAANQLAALSLNNVTTSGLSGLEYYDTTANQWISYTSGNVPLDSAGHLLVRVAINPERDTLLDGPETFNLVATNTGGVSATGVGTVVDDGSGDYVDYSSNASPTPLALPLASALDDDRPLRVDDIAINEGSPKAVFSVMGAAGQYIKLALSDGTAKVDANGTPLTDGSEDYGPALQVYINGAWSGYSPANFVQIPAGGALLVRTAIINDSSWENAQTFKLTATNTGGTPDTGVATIMDDGTGDYWIGDATAPATSGQLETAQIALDDDRPIMVTGATYNEGSPRAVFEVEAHAGQMLTLAVEDVQTSDLSSAPVYYSVDGGANWVKYNGTAFAAGAAHVLVAVDITGEADAPYEGSEELKLVVNKNQGTEASGSSFIVDDGTGNIAPEIDATSKNVADPMADLGGIKDDDRPVKVNSPTVNEASPYAVFVVEGGANQRVTLALSDGSASAADYGPDLEVSVDDGQTWLPYNVNGVTLNGSGQLLVRTPVRQDTNYERAETFTLTATNNSGVAAPGTATIVDDGTGTIFNDNGTENTSARKDDDRPVAPLIEPAAVPAPSIVPPAPAPTAPAVHVMVAVAEGRQAVSSGASDSAAGAVAARAVSGGAGNTTLQKTDVLIDKFDRATDPNLFVLPEVKATRGQAPEATSQAYAMQSGLLVQELAPNTSIAVTVQVSQAPTSADQTLAGLLNLSDAPDTVDRVQMAELTEQERADMLARKQALHLSAAREAQRLESQAQASARGQFGFSKQLQMSAAKRQLVVPANLS